MLSCNPKANYIKHKDEIISAVERVLDSGEYILGPEVSSFENKFAHYLGVKYAVGVANGTEALFIALSACGIGPGDEVITVSHTAVATISGIVMTGATPVLVDIDPYTYTIDVNKIEKSITKNTKAILPVHLYGYPAEMDDIKEIVRKKNIRIIEDCSQAHGAKYKDKLLGTIGDMGVFSFYPTKNLGGYGDGGMIVTNHQSLMEILQGFRQYGWKKERISESHGINSRLDELQAAILHIKLTYLDIDNLKRREIAARYQESLPKTSLQLPYGSDGAYHVYHQYVVRAQNRDQLRAFLDKNQIGTNIHYPVPVHLHPGYKDKVRISDNLLETEIASDTIISLPMYPEMTDEDVHRVCEKIQTYFIQ